MKRTILALLVLISIFTLSSCGNSSLKSEIEFNHWATEEGDEGSSIRLEFTSTTAKYVNVIEGEDAFIQDFNYTLVQEKLTLENQYATLTFDVSLEKDILTLKSESGETLVFKKK